MAGAAAKQKITLTSSKNPLLQGIRRAIVKGTLTEDGCCVAESFHLLEEAIRGECEIRGVLCANSVQGTVQAHVRGLKHLKVAVVPDDLFTALSATESSQGVITLVKAPAWTLEQLFRGNSMVLVLDGLQDPGNAGAILRAAEAFGATGVMLLKGTVNPYNPKALRASAGSAFRLPIVTGLDPTLARAALKQHRLDVYAANPRGIRNLHDVDLSRRFALVIGSEGRGVSDTLGSAAIDLRITTSGVESLNAAMAAGIILHEASRQRLIRK
jgi:TrmH family RNA methyltransferase